MARGKDARSGRSAADCACLVTSGIRNSKCLGKHIAMLLECSGQADGEQGREPT